MQHLHFSDKLITKQHKLHPLDWEQDFFSKLIGKWEEQQDEKWLVR